MRKFFLDMRNDFLLISNLYLVEIISEPNSLTIARSTKILKMNNYVLILSIFFHNENQELAVYIFAIHQRSQVFLSRTLALFKFLIKISG